jgi:rubrerythrin
LEWGVAEVAMKDFHSLNDKEILALAISLEEEDERVYSDYVEGLRENFPSTAAVFEEMRKQETGHRQRLIELYRKRFGEHIPLIRRQDVKGFVSRQPLWLSQPLQLDKIRGQASAMEVETRRFYERAAARASDAGTRQLFDDLAQEERSHAERAQDLEREKLGQPEREQEENAKRRLFVLQIIQPGLAGLMDGSVSTLAPVFAAAFATRNSWDAFAVGLAASVGAGISMGFAEALSDDGSLTGRGRPLLRGVIEGLMTTVGGIGHTLPYLIHDFRVATLVAVVVVIVELAIISWVRHRYMDTPPLTAAVQVGLGGALVFATGILIGSS